VNRTKLQPLTSRQRQVWRFIADYHRRERIGLAIRDICTRFKFASPNGAICHLDALARKGWIHRRRYMSRSIVPTKESLDGAA